MTSEISHFQIYTFGSFIFTMMREYSMDNLPGIHQYLHVSLQLNSSFYCLGTRGSATEHWERVRRGKGDTGG